MYIFLILLFFIFYFYLALRRIDLAVLFILVALPSYLIRFSVFGVPMTLLELMILSAFGAWFIRNSKNILDNLKLKAKSKKLKVNSRYPFDFEIILVLIISFIAVGAAGFSDSALGIWKAYFFEPMLLYILIINIGVSDKEFIKKIIYALGLSVLVVSIIAIYQKITGQFIYNEFWANSQSRRVVSFFGYPNAVGLYLGPIVMLLASFILDNIKLVKKKLRAYKLWLIIFGLMAIIFSLMAIYSAKSKGAMLGIGAGLIIFGLLYNRYIRRAIIGTGLIFGIGLLFFNPGINSTYESTFGSTYAGVYEKIIYSKSFQIRKQGWIESWEMLKDGRLIFGAGLSSFQKAIKPYHKEGFFYNDGSDPDFHRHTVFNEEYRARVWQPLEIYMYPHNIFLNFWSELGLFGMILFIWIIGKFFYVGLQLRGAFNASVRNIAIGLICAMVVIVVHGLVDVPYFKNDLAVIFWVLVGIMGILKISSFPQINKSSHKSTNKVL